MPHKSAVEFWVIFEKFSEDLSLAFIKPWPYFCWVCLWLFKRGKYDRLFGEDGDQFTLRQMLRCGGNCSGCGFLLARVYKRPFQKFAEARALKWTILVSPNHPLHLNRTKLRTSDFKSRRDMQWTRHARSEWQRYGAHYIHAQLSKWIENSGKER